MTGFIFLNQEETEILQEGLGSTPATSFKTGEDNTGVDNTGTDNTGLDPAMKDDTGEDDTGNELDDDGDEPEDGSELDETPDDADPVEDDTTGGIDDGAAGGETPEGEGEESASDKTLLRKKSELFSLYTDLLNATQDLNKATSLENIKDKFDVSSQRAISIIRNTTETTANILRTVIVEDFKDDSYENLLFLYTRHLSTIKMASEIFKSMNDEK